VAPLPEAVCFNESFRYWVPKKFNPDVTSEIYINDKLDDDIHLLFNKITLIGKVSNPESREYGTSVYLCECPKSSYNDFWREKLYLLKTKKNINCAGRIWQSDFIPNSL
jgi:hypothetical protein